uniref:BTB domain-containing protein n=1 Tax=Panagrolaimus davidi TaxID=227884 RepID=A0A914Q2A1_9BILA
MESSSFDEIICPFETEWKFHKADLMDLVVKENGFALKDIYFYDECLKGKFYYAYNIPGLQYFLAIYPTGEDEQERGETWLKLHVNGSIERKITAEFTLSVESANFSRNSNYVYDGHQRHGPFLCKTEEFFDSKSKYFGNGEVTIKVKGIFKAKRPSTSITSAPISLQWRIKEYDLKVEMKESDNGRLFSKPVVVSTFSGVSYRLSFTPNEINDENQSEAIVRLHVKFENEEKIEAVYDYCIDSAKYREGGQHIFEPESGDWGFYVCSTNDLFDPLKSFIVDGVLTINFNGVLMAKNYRFFTLKRNDKDFMIVVGNKTIHVHKKLLIETSCIWAEMLNSETKEAVENKMVIQDFPFEIVDIAVKLIYDKRISLKNPLEDMLLLYKFGQKYRIKFIMDLIEEDLIKEISPANVVHLLKFSSPDALNVIKLHQKCIDCFVKCLKETTPIYAAESLGETFLASMLLKSLRANFTDTNTND